MRLVTIATHSDAYYPFLIKSCKRFNTPIEVLGWGKKWTGFSFKSMLIKEYLKTIPDNEIICVIDSFDVILLRPIEELEIVFKTFSKQTGVKIIVGCDKKPSNIVKIINHAQFGTCHGISINAGTYIGYAKQLRKLINEIYITPDLDDQILLTKYIQTHPHRVYIDTSSLFFLTINNPTGVFIYDREIMNVKKKILWYRGIRPFFAHGNGNTDMIELIKELGYDISNHKIKSIREKGYITQYKKAVEYYHVPIISIIALLLLGIILYYIVKNKNRLSSKALENQ